MKNMILVDAQVGISQLGEWFSGFMAVVGLLLMALGKIIWDKLKVHDKRHDAAAIRMNMISAKISDKDRENLKVYSELTNSITKLNGVLNRIDSTLERQDREIEKLRDKNK